MASPYIFFRHCRKFRHSRKIFNTRSTRVQMDTPLPGQIRNFHYFFFIFIFFFFQPGKNFADPKSTGAKSFTWIVQIVQDNRSNPKKQKEVFIMAQFYAEIQGNRSQVSRMGSKQSGMWGHIRGWESGIEVDAVHVDGVDIFHVYQTFGSNGGTKRIFLGTLKDGVFEPAKK